MSGASGGAATATAVTLGVGGVAALTASPVAPAGALPPGVLLAVTPATADLAFAATYLLVGVGILGHLLRVHDPGVPDPGDRLF